MAPLGLVIADGKGPSKITVVFNHTFNVVEVIYTFILYHVLLLTGLVFDEAILIARRVLDNFTTPYLVLHDDSGAPCALINLKDLTIHDYSTSEFKIYPCDDDHKVVIQEFREEYLSSLEEFAEDTFAFGLFIPAIPVSVKADIGFNEIMELIKPVNDQQSL